MPWCFDAFPPKFSCHGCQFTWTSLCLTISQIYKYCISILLGLCIFTVTFAIPVAVTLELFIVVVSCGCYSSYQVSLMVFSSFPFINSALSSASTDNAATNLSIWHRVNIAPLRFMGCLSCGFHPRKKCSTAWILESLSDK